MTSLPQPVAPASIGAGNTNPDLGAQKWENIFLWCKYTLFCDLASVKLISRFPDTSETKFVNDLTQANKHKTARNRMFFSLKWEILNKSKWPLH